MCLLKSRAGVRVRGWRSSNSSRSGPRLGNWVVPPFWPDAVVGCGLRVEEVMQADVGAPAVLLLTLHDLCHAHAASMRILSPFVCARMCQHAHARTGELGQNARTATARAPPSVRITDTRVNRWLLFLQEQIKVNIISRTADTRVKSTDTSQLTQESSQLTQVN